jgi:hypothetical protein
MDCLTAEGKLKKSMSKETNGLYGEREVTTDVEDHERMVSIHTLYSRGPGFKSLPADRLSGLLQFFHTTVRIVQ